MRVYCFILVVLVLAGCEGPRQFSDAAPAPTQTISSAEAPAATGTPQAMATSTFAPPTLSPTPSKQLSTPLPSRTIISDTFALPISIDFATCEPSEPPADVVKKGPAFVFRILGHDGDVCVMDYAPTVSNIDPATDLTVHCRVPVTLGMPQLSISPVGLNMQAIAKYCK